MKTEIRHASLIVLALALVSLGGLLIHSATHGHWDASVVYATLFVGFIAASVVVWQGSLIKQQVAFSTYLDLDKEWNSDEMVELRQTVHAPDSKEWNRSRLEGILEFFEKLAVMYQLSGEMSFIYRSTLGWYGVRYFLFAREHGQIEDIRKVWKEHVYGDIEAFYDFYLTREVGRSKKARKAWEATLLTTESHFWKQERKE
jgi:hypothetical protein